MQINQLATFGDQRRMILDVICELKNGTMDVNRGMAIAANMKVLNDSVQTEINAVKMSIAARQAGHDFGRVVGMGQKFIGNNQDQSSQHVPHPPPPTEAPWEPPALLDDDTWLVGADVDE